jgi:hypothetical protein
LLRSARGSHRGLPAARAAWSAYREAAGADAPRFEEVARYAGLELLRRTLGAARVPALASVAASLAAVERGERWARKPPADPPGSSTSRVSPPPEEQVVSSMAH